MKKTLFTALRSLLVLVLFLLSGPCLFAQSNQISGTVKTTSGQPLPGATVVLKGSTQGVTTDKDGRYAVAAGNGKVLVVSFIGYQAQELTVGDNPEINIALSESSASLNEVIVTAENRAVSVQETAIAIDVVGGLALQRQGVTDLGQLPNLAPGLNYRTDTVFNSFTVRGIGSHDGSAELSDQAITVGVDGEYLNRPVALNTAMFDLDRVEVLKGPQGTLYGRNATAGAVNIIAKKPTDKFETTVSATVGNYATVKLQGAVNVPLAKTLSVRVAGILDRHDGYRDGGPAGRIDNGNMRAGRLGLLFKPTNALSVYVAGELSKVDQQAPSQYGVDISKVVSVSAAPSTFDLALPKDYPVATGGFVDINQAALRGRLQYDFGPATLTYTGGYRTVDMTGYQPLNGFVPETFSFDNSLAYQTQSHELRLSGESDKFIWQGGLFYGHEDQDVGRGLILPALSARFGGAPYLSFFQRKVASTTQAIFAQATYRLTNRLSLTGGIRNTTDKKERFNADLASAPFAPNAVVFTYPNRPTSFTQRGIVESKNIPTSGNWNQTTWLVDLDYKIGANKLLFAKASTGYKAGGFDNIGEYRPERLTAFEIGSKNEFMNKRLRLNLAAFTYNYSDQQVSIFISTAVGNAIQNAGRTSVSGIELDGEWLATKADRFKFTVNYLDAKFKDLPTLENRVGINPVPVNLAGNRPIQSPKWTLVGGYDHYFTLGSGELNLGVRSMFKSDYYLTAFNWVADRQEAYTKTDLNLTYSARGGKWSVGAYVWNLEDNRIINFSAFTGSTINLYNFIFGTPRTYGIQANVRF